MIVVVDPGMASTNLGDRIISEAVAIQLIRPLRERGAEVVTVPMHGTPTPEELSAIRDSAEVIVCGTNLLSDHMRFGGSWQWQPTAVAAAKGKLTFFGVGWWQYQTGRIDPLSARWLRRLTSGRPWAVRDEYSFGKLARAGIPAVHLSCPTLWSVRAQKLPGSMSRVVVTFSDYNQNVLADRYLMGVLRERFDEVLYWPQGPGDEQYIRAISDGRPKFIGPSVEAFDDALHVAGTAYVGLRLHGGIRAMQQGVPALVLAIDNRAREIARSTGLIAPSRFAMRDLGEELLSSRDIVLRVPQRDIESWMSGW